MANKDPKNKSQTSSEVLSPKDATSFKNMMDMYNNKNYKKALKIAESLLVKYPDHGETLSVKALLLLFLEPKREEEIIELAKRGLKYGINSYLCWHVLGVIYKHVKRYSDTVKCFIMAMKLDPHNDRLLREICCLQIELKDYLAFNKFGSIQLKLKSKEYREWMLFAFSHHLIGNLSISCEILEEADKLFNNIYRVEDYELSESIMYRAMLYEHLGEFEKCYKLLDQKFYLLKDKLTYLELKGKALYLSKKYESANETYKILMELNPNNSRYVFMFFLSHPDERIRNLFLFPYNFQKKPEKGSIYDEKLKEDSKNFAENKMELPENQNYAILLSDEILDFDGEYSSAGWSIEHKLYHNFDRYINFKSVVKDSTYFNCNNHPQYVFKVSNNLDLGSLPSPDSFSSINDVIQLVDSYLSDFPDSDIVVYSKYRRYLKRDKYPLFMLTRSLNEEEEDLILESLRDLALKDKFTLNSFLFLFSSGLKFYELAQKYIRSSIDRGSINVIKSFVHCLTFKKAYILLYILSVYREKLIKGQRIDGLSNTFEVKPNEHEVSCHFRLVLVTLSLAKVYDFMGSYKKSLSLLDSISKIAPTSVDLMCLKGKIFRHLGDFKRSCEQYCMASDIDRSDRQTSAKSAKSIIRTYDFEFGLKRWRSFLTEDVCFKTDKEAPPEIPSFKFELMYARAKLDLYLKSTLDDNFDLQKSTNLLKESFAKYMGILEKHEEIYHNQLDFHNYCLNRLSYRIYYNFLKLRNVYCSQGYFIKALKGSILCSIELYKKGVECELEVENECNHKNLSYCVKVMKKVLNQSVYDPGLFSMFYKLVSICKMNILLKLQCMTRCFYSSRCDKLNHNLFQIVYDFIYNFEECTDSEMKMVKDTLELCVESKIIKEFQKIDKIMAKNYLEHVLERVLNERYGFKEIKGLVTCTYNTEDKTFLEKLFEKSRILYTEITFKDYLKFKRFLIYTIQSCNIEENKNFLKNQMEVLVKECSKVYVVDNF